MTFSARHGLEHYEGIRTHIKINKSSAMIARYFILLILISFCYMDATELLIETDSSPCEASPYTLL